MMTKNWLILNQKREEKETTKSVMIEYKENIHVII